MHPSEQVFGGALRGKCARVLREIASSPQRRLGPRGVKNAVLFTPGIPACAGMTGRARRRPGPAPSVAVMVRLERALGRDSDVAGLLLGELGQLDAQLVEVERGDLLVEMLGKDVDVV